MALASHPEIEEEPVVFAIYGAGNARHLNRNRLVAAALWPWVALEHLHAEASAHIYEHMSGGDGVDEIIVPPFFGIGPPSFIYNRAKDALDRKMGRYPDETRKVILAHSLGVTMAMRYVHDHPEHNAKVVGFAGALGEVNIPRLGTPLPISGRLFDRQTEEIAAARQVLGRDAPEITLIGSANDSVIPPRSALPDIDGVARYLLTTADRAEEAARSGITPLVVGRPPDHVGIVNDPSVIPFYPSSARQAHLELVS